MKRPSAEPERPRKERRQRGLLALAVLLIGVALGVEICRRLWVQGGPEGLAGDWGPMVLPAPAVREPSRQEKPAVKDLTVGEFLSIVSKKTPPLVKDKFLRAFARQPELKQALIDFHKTRGEKAPARELLKALLEKKGFRDVMEEMRQEPAFRQAFSDATKDAEVTQTLRGSITLVRAGGLAAPPVRGGPGGPEAEAQGGNIGPPPAPPPETPPERSAGETDDQPPGSQDAVKLSTITQNVGARNAAKYIPSAFAVMPREQLAELKEACEKYDFCDPVPACRITGLWEECAKACRKTGSKCPPELAQDNAAHQTQPLTGYEQQP